MHQAALMRLSLCLHVLGAAYSTAHDMIRQLQRQGLNVSVSILSLHNIKACGAYVLYYRISIRAHME